MKADKSGAWVTDLSQLDFADNAATLYAFAKLEEGDVIAAGGLRYSVSSVAPYELSVVGYDGPLSTLVVPELVVFEGSVFDVTSIGPKAFYGCTTLVSADLGNVSKVGVKAFAQCKQLKTVDAGDGLSIISAYAFCNCARLVDFDLNGSLKTMSVIGSYAFYKDSKLGGLAIPSFVATVGDSAFSLPFSDERGNMLSADAKSLAGYVYVNINGTLVRQPGVELGREFSWNGLTLTVTASLPAEVGISGYSGKPTSLVISGPVELEGTVYDITSVMKDAFKGCRTLISAELPGIERLDAQAFYGCSKLASVAVPDLKSVGVKAFARCTSLAEIDLGDSLTAISAYGFWGCTSLESLVLPDTVRSIGTYAFQRCSSLSSIDLAESLRLIGSKAFDGTAVVSLEIPDTIVRLKEDALSGCSGLREVSFEGGEKVILHAGVFEGDPSIDRIAMPEGFKKIYAGAFDGITFLDGNGNALAVKAENLAGHVFVGSAGILRLSGGSEEGEITVTVSVSCQNATVSVNGGSSVSSYSVQTVKGSSVTLVATPNSGYGFDGYYVNGSKVSSDAVYTFTVGSSDISVKAVATKTIDKLVINGGNSTVYVNGQSVGRTYVAAMQPGTHVTAYAVADDGYIVTGWAGAHSTSGPVCEFVFDSAVTMSVQTQAASKGTSQVHVTTALEGVAASSYGSILAYEKNVGNDYTVTLEVSGASLQLSAAAEAGFAFDHWVIGGKSNAGKTIAITVGSDDLEVKGVFVPAASHKLSATIDNGSVQIDGEAVTYKLVKEGFQVVLKAVPADGYRFVGWYYGGSCVSISEEYAVTMGQSDMAFEAKTQRTVFNVSLSASNGTIEVNDVDVGTTYSGTINVGGTIVFKAIAAEGFAFSTWTVNGNVYNANKITVTGASEDITAVATMVKAAVRTVTASADYGTVFIDGVSCGKAGSVQAYDGKEVTISVDVPYGYVLRGWTYEDKYVSTDPSFTFRVSGDMAFKAVVVSTLHTLTLKAVNGGLIINSAIVGSEYAAQLYTGESLVVSAAPSAGNTFSEWDINGKKYGAGYQAIEIRMGSEDIVATAYNVPMADGTLHITATNGTVKVDDKDVGDYYDIKASSGQKFTLTAVPNAGYRFDHWVLDGETSEFQIVTVTMGTEHVNAEAVMVKNESHTVTVTIDHGSIIYNNVDLGSRLSVVVDDKTVVTVSAKPLTGYALAGWYDGDSLVTFASDYQFQANSDVSLTVRTVVNPVYQ
jgi:hypothetical protein